MSEDVGLKTAGRLEGAILRVLATETAVEAGVGVEVGKFAMFKSRGRGGAYLKVRSLRALAVLGMAARRPEKPRSFGSEG
jgi:hypothetical protein